MRSELEPGSVAILIFIDSDGPTPEAMSQQILSVAPILKGQTSQNTAFSSRKTNIAAAPPPAASDDLIDFGQSDNSTLAPGNGQTHPPGESHNLQDPLTPGQAVKRVDTLTSDLDEFVDAKP